MELVLDLLRMSAIRLILARDFIRTQSKPNRVLGLKKKIILFSLVEPWVSLIEMEG